MIAASKPAGAEAALGSNVSLICIGLVGVGSPTLIFSKGGRAQGRTVHIHVVHAALARPALLWPRVTKAIVLVGVFNGSPRPLSGSGSCAFACFDRMLKDKC